MAATHAPGAPPSYDDSMAPTLLSNFSCTADEFCKVRRKILHKLKDPECVITPHLVAIGGRHEHRKLFSPKELYFCGVIFERDGSHYELFSPLIALERSFQWLCTILRADRERGIWHWDKFNSKIINGPTRELQWKWDVCQPNNFEEFLEFAEDPYGKERFRMLT
ncbi:hypothetical protein Pelo_11768 [Pelomyxa schiedti]|nr:hypothetical protein Pelo_11768 [Pelomyxa schiedti]